MVHHFDGALSFHDGSEPIGCGDVQRDVTDFKALDNVECSVSVVANHSITVQSTIVEHDDLATERGQIHRYRFDVEFGIRNMSHQSSSAATFADDQSLNKAKSNKNRCRVVFCGDNRGRKDAFNHLRFGE